MPHGMERFLPYSICLATEAMQVWSRRVDSKEGMTSIGIRYSNMEPLQDNRTGSPPAVVSSRPIANQLSCGICPWAMATKAASRASEARRS
ncbi:hypothetical protein DSECCO2_362110 [anaerobic digester metagenome]